MTTLPGDIKRYLALTRDMSLRKILDLCQLNKEYNRDICDNLAFWRALLQDRYGYTAAEVHKMTLEQLKNAIKEAETTYTLEEGLALINRIEWIVGDNNLEEISVNPTDLGVGEYHGWPTLADPKIQAIMLKRINFKKPLILYVEDYDPVIPGEGPDVELELPAIISPMEIIGELARYYESERQRLGFDDIIEMMDIYTVFEGLEPHEDGYRVNIAG